MHFITNEHKRFSKTNSTDPRERVPLMAEQYESMVDAKDGRLMLLPVKHVYTLANCLIIQLARMLLCH